MTPFRNDDTNPYSRPSVWPKMPQTPLSIGVLPRRASPAPPAPAPALPVAEAELTAAAAEAELAIPEPAPEPAAQAPIQPPPIAAPIGMRPARASRPAPRLTPLIAAGAVGAGGMAAVFLLIGGRPAARLPAAAPAPPSAALAVGEMVGETAPASPAVAQAIATTPAAPPAALPGPRATRASLASRASSAAGGSSVAPPVRIQPDAAEPVATPLLLSPPRPIASLVGPAEPPLAAIPAPAPFVPPPAPDRNAPIATHVPD